MKQGPDAEPPAERRDEGFTDLAAVVTDTARLARPILRADGIELGYDLAPDVPLPAGERPALMQALLEVLTAGVHAAGPRGRIHVEAAEDGDGGVDLCVSITPVDGAPGLEASMLAAARAIVTRRGGDLSVADGEEPPAIAVRFRLPRPSAR